MTLKIFVNHFHQGNDPQGTVRLNLLTAKAEREGKMMPPTPVKPLYATVARLVETETGIESDHEIAFCSPRDNPCKKTGRSVAIGRLLKRHPELLDS